MDSIDTEVTAKVIANFTRILFIAPLCLLLNQKQILSFTKIIILLTVFASLDAIIQWLSGYSIAGLQSDPVRITGVFGPKYQLGYVIATLSPLVLWKIIDAISKCSKYTYLWIFLYFCTIFTVFLAGSRAGWISLFCGMVLTLLWIMSHYKVRLKWILVGFCITSIILGGISQTPIVKARFEKSMQYLTNKNETILDRLTSYRTIIWKVAIKEVQKSPINGIGAGTFREAFNRVSPDEKGFFPEAYHVHFYALEVLTETGIIGLIPYLILCLSLFIFIIKEQIFPTWLIIAFLAIMPINMHVSFYGSFWFPMIWISLMIGLRYHYLQKI